MGHEAHEVRSRRQARHIATEKKPQVGPRPVSFLQYQVSGDSFLARRAKSVAARKAVGPRNVREPLAMRPGALYLRMLW